MVMNYFVYRNLHENSIRFQQLVLGWNVNLVLGGLTLADRRTSLDPNQLDKMPCIHAVVDLNKQG
jgi:hypothetical protein